MFYVCIMYMYYFWQILFGLNELRKEGHFCDVTLSVDGVKFPAHRNVLASFSPYFKVRFLNLLFNMLNLVETLKF
jgi:hypothetical protein